jgi:glycosyltransferase involved in cell wall biosynthesis
MARITIVARGNAVENDNIVNFQRLDAQLLSGLCEHGHQVVCLSPLISSSNPLNAVFSVYDAHILYSTFSLVPLPAYDSSQMSLARKLTVWTRTAKRIWQPIRSSDVVIVFMPSPIGFLGFAIAKLLHMPLVVYYGGDWTAYLGGTQPSCSISAQAYMRCASWLRGLLERLVYWQSRILLVRNKKVYERLSGRRSGVHLAATFTSFSIKHVFERKDTCQNGRVICLTVGALVPNKGISDTLHAIRIVLNAGYSVQWWHAGGSYPEYRCEIERLIKDLGLFGYVELYGYLKQEELISIYRQSDILIHASHSEGMPRVLAEAMSQGLPVIATRVGGVAQAFKDGYHALLIEPQRPEFIADAIMQLINDTLIRQKLIDQGREWAIEELSRADPLQQILSLLPQC